MPRARRALWTGLLLAFALLPTARAQQATERYIPLGRSPGLSPAETRIGEIEAVDPEARRLALAGADGRFAVQVGESTRIWLDRTALGRSNAEGSLADCHPGRTAEVHFARPGGGPLAAWIKLRIEGPGAGP